MHTDPMAWARSVEWILGSASPRRRRFLELLRLAYRVHPHGLDEEALGIGIPARELAARLARTKLEAIVSDLGNGRLAGRPVLCADTTVVLDDRALGQPADRDRAREMLRALAGREHVVVTALAIGWEGRVWVREAAARVRFGTVDPALVEWYLDTEEWRGAAGGYRLQEAGEVLVESIEGAPSCVAGLPLRAFYGIMADILRARDGSETLRP